MTAAALRGLRDLLPSSRGRRRCYGAPSFGPGAPALPLTSRILEARYPRQCRCFHAHSRFLCQMSLIIAVERRSLRPASSWPLRTRSVHEIWVSVPRRMPLRLDPDVAPKEPGNEQFYWPSVFCPATAASGGRCTSVAVCESTGPGVCGPDGPTAPLGAMTKIVDRSAGTHKVRA